MINKSRQKGAASVEYIVVTTACLIALLMPLNDNYQPSSSGKNVVVRLIENIKANHKAYSYANSVSSVTPNIR